MHAYDAPRRQAFPLVPAPVRSAQGSPGGPSATPIYDALYAEYVKSFRSLPGDRSGEDKLGFTAFGSIPHRTSPSGGADSSVGHGSGTFGGGSYGAYEAGAGSARRTAGQQPQWQQVTAVGRHAIGMHHVPAALPPAPRREA
ncbi:hypothetical protein ABZ892_27360 [Streptomyces sp. NPDC046924]|uniref:hypothetical protein n=1 Tax=Streptomyces sp. NPDC046924 TaxID=3155136 RepID=UPI0033FA9036